MSTEQIFGSWDKARNPGDKLELLYHRLAAQNIGTRDFLPNSGLTQKAAEIIPLWELFVRQQPKVIVEVGVAQGGSFASWAQLAPDDATLIGIDRDLNDVWPRAGNQVHPMIAHLTDKMTEQGGGLYALKRQRSNQTIIGINGWTTDPATQQALFSQLNGKTIDFLFHDASHWHETFHVDFEWLWPLVSEGGVFASHDICPCTEHADSNKAPEWDRIKSEETYSALYEFRGPRNQSSFGIGVLIK